MLSLGRTLWQRFSLGCLLQILKEYENLQREKKNVAYSKLQVQW